MIDSVIFHAVAMNHNVQDATATVSFEYDIKLTVQFESYL